MDEIVAVAGRKSNCTFCGVFRRQALDRGAWQLGVDIVATGHNADDIAETVIMNMIRGDVGRLARCTAITTADDPSGIPRVKPLKYQYEAEIVKYARHNKVRYFSTECTYAPGAHRGHIREFLRAATKIRPQGKIFKILEIFNKDFSSRSRHNQIGRGVRSQTRRQSAD